MAEEFSYIENRLEDQRKWHSNNAIRNKYRFYFFEVIVLVAGAFIPIINVFDIFSEIWLRVASTGLAAIIVIAGGVSRLFKFQENWINYRTVSEALKRERIFYTNEVGEYGTKNEQTRNKLLVDRVENILSGSTSQYLSMHLEEREAAQGSQAMAESIE